MKLPRLGIARAWLALALLGPFFGACDSTGPESITGTYQLTTVLGTTVPAVVIQFPDYKLEILEGSATLNADTRSPSGSSPARPSAAP